VTGWLMSKNQDLFANAATVRPFYWGDPVDPFAIHRTTRRRRIAIPGAVNFRNRDYPAILSMLPEITRHIARDEIEIAVIGGGQDRERLEAMVEAAGYSNCFRFAARDPRTGFVNYDVYLAELRKSAFILPMLPEKRMDYRTFKISAALSTSAGLGIPAIIDRWTAAAYGLPSVAYPPGRMIEGLVAATSMDFDATLDLARRLAEFRHRTMIETITEARHALSALPALAGI